MSERVVVPEGMLDAAYAATNGITTGQSVVVRDGLEAALLWLSEHPIVPTDEKIGDSYRNCNGGFGLQADDPESAYANGFRHGANWSQRLFAPEPDVPEAVKDLLRSRHSIDGDEINADLIEAYRRGLRGKGANHV